MNQPVVKPVVNHQNPHISLSLSWLSLRRYFITICTSLFSVSLSLFPHIVVVVVVTTRKRRSRKQKSFSLSPSLRGVRDPTDRPTDFFLSFLSAQVLVGAQTHIRKSSLAIEFLMTILTISRSLVLSFFLSLFTSFHSVSSDETKQNKMKERDVKKKIFNK